VYICEFYATDISSEYAAIRVPTIALVAGFSPEILADSTLSYVKRLFVDSWTSAQGANPLFTVRTVSKSRVFVTDDQPTVVRAAIDSLASNRQRSPNR